MKGVFLRGNIWWVRYSFLGRQKFESLKTEDEAEAIIKAKELLNDPSELKKGDFTFAVKEYVTEKLRLRKFRTSTANARECTLHLFASSYDIKSPRDITPRIAAEYYASMPESHANTYFAWLRRFCDWCIENKLIRENPCKKVKVATEKVRRNWKYVDKSLVKSLLANCTDPDLKMLLFLGFDCGLRKGEIVEARPGWINLEAGTLRVSASEHWQPKDVEQRTIPLTRRFMEFLRGYPALPSPFLVKPSVKPKKPKPDGRVKERYNPRMRFFQYMESQGVPWITFKVMRQSFGSTRVSGGAEIAKVSRWMGHSKVQTTMDHYLSFAPRDEAIERGVE